MWGTKSENHSKRWMQAPTHGALTCEWGISWATAAWWWTLLKPQNASQKGEKVQEDNKESTNQTDPDRHHHHHHTGPAQQDEEEAKTKHLLSYILHKLFSRKKWNQTPCSSRNEPDGRTDTYLHGRHWVAGRPMSQVDAADKTVQMCPAAGFYEVERCSLIGEYCLFLGDRKRTLRMI